MWKVFGFEKYNIYLSTNQQKLLGREDHGRKPKIPTTGLVKED
jgi:hypothetical protein